MTSEVTRSLFCYPVSHYTRNAICKDVCAKIFKSIDSFKDVQDWILKYERIRKKLCVSFLTEINPRSLGLWWIKGTEESTLKMDSSDPLTHHDPSDLGLIYLIKEYKISFRILSE